jgi:hypothetical protein
MLVGEIRQQIDGIWNDFWSGGLSNPLAVIEQITYLLFIKRLDELQELEERKATTLVPPVHLEPEVLQYLAARADARGTSLSELVNQLLKKDIELIEAAR